jgi:hypothetical protein
MKIYIAILLVICVTANWGGNNYGNNYGNNGFNDEAMMLWALQNQNSGVSRSLNSSDWHHWN